MLITTTPTVEGSLIDQYHGLVAGEAIMGANVFRDMFVSVRDIVGGRSAAYEQELRKAKDLALGRWRDRLRSSAATPLSRSTSTTRL